MRILPGMISGLGWRQMADASYFSGMLDEVRVWNRSLAQSEIAEI